MFSFLKKNDLDEAIYAPVKGQLVQLENVPDPIFADKIMGNGIAIIPKDNVICSPCDGSLTMIAESLHAFGITMKNGCELIVHIGLETVNLKGKYFSALKKEGASVKHGEPIILADIDKIKEQNINPITMVIVTNNEKYVPINTDGKVSKSDVVIKME